MVEVVRTPEERFAGLAGFDHPPHYLDVEVGDVGLRLARVELGPPDSASVVLLHGEPTWGYLYREVVGPLAAAGYRTILPDLPGFGRSDKPADPGWYSYDRLAEAFAAHLAAAVPSGPLTLVVHDWGGPIGLRWAVEHPDRVAGLVILDTALYAPGGRPSEAWQRFRDFVARGEELPIGWLVDGGTVRELGESGRAAYEAPFPDLASQAGARALPLLVPTADGDPGAGQMWAVLQALGEWTAPTLLIWGADDQVLPPRIGQRWARDIPGCVGMHVLPGAGHFLQEDAGRRIGELIAGFLRDHVSR